MKIDLNYPIKGPNQPIKMDQLIANCWLILPIIN